MTKLFLVCGYVASGKTTVSNALSKSLEVKVIRTDDVRKRLFPKEFDHSSRDEIESWLEANEDADLQQVLNPLREAYADLIGKYAPKMKEQKELVYNQAFVELDNLLSIKEDVLFDATFSNVGMRKRAYELATKNNIETIYIVQVVCSEEIVKARLQKRASGKVKTTSNAKELDIYRKVKKEFDESQIQNDNPEADIVRFLYNTGTQAISMYGKEDKTTKEIQNVLTKLSKKYGGV
ncbi:MAG: ATP-binding protein [Candidatus Pacebacteria bacterium]|nr:ATP-binding protein [Candidatus Paceibacterota bacterium]MDD2796607.1 ATP-binding protein [Candidatus Paceibacterota bacterium]MDD3047894.1 ATP-binding protein [Candidatus Paceibacterota bacterium]MDD3509952.1 ATP-binding protein [Candidatus Paceibacterota bacterium]MDD3918531.1 ATP-binding protein [Candidatus Paceibacterota bacterium]